MKKLIIGITLLLLLVSCGNNSKENIVVDSKDTYSKDEENITNSQKSKNGQDEKEIANNKVRNDKLELRKGKLELSKDKIDEDVTEEILEVKEETEDKEDKTEVNNAPKASEIKGITSNLDNTTKSWYFGRNSKQVRPSAQSEIDLSLYSGYYLGDDSKSIYLTFDEGYENGYTSKILDVLLEKNVKAAFFVTEPYINDNKELIIRMVNEGHIVGNHSSTHPSFPTLSDEKIVEELNKTAKTFEEVTGVKINSYFRPPRGEYSERVLDIVNQMGYDTIFWSLAYKDWIVEEQPTTEEAIRQGTYYAHNGCIMLLHAVSKANTDALPSIIDNLRESGYTFETLDNL